jgi:hypothetical protein
VWCSYHDDCRLINGTRSGILINFDCQHVKTIDTNEKQLDLLDRVEDFLLGDIVVKRFGKLSPDGNKRQWQDPLEDHENPPVM